MSQGRERTVSRDARRGDRGASKSVERSNPDKRVRVESRLADRRCVSVEVDPGDPPRWERSRARSIPLARKHRADRVRAGAGRPVRSRCSPGRTRHENSASERRRFSRRGGPGSRARRERERATYLDGAERRGGGKGEGGHLRGLDVNGAFVRVPRVTTTRVSTLSKRARAFRKLPLAIDRAALERNRGSNS